MTGKTTLDAFVSTGIMPTVNRLTAHQSQNDLDEIETYCCACGTAFMFGFRFFGDETCPVCGEDLSRYGDKEEE